MTKRCKLCGCFYNENEFDDCEIKDIMIQEHLCFTDAFWEEKFRIADKNTFVVNHQRYHGSLIDKSQVKGFVGCGGADFYVKYNDGRVMHYNNVWFQGDIPKRWWNKIPNNAELITKEEYLTLNAVV